MACYYCKGQNDKLIAQYVACFGMKYCSHKLSFCSLLFYYFSISMHYYTCRSIKAQSLFQFIMIVHLISNYPFIFLHINSIVLEWNVNNLEVKIRGTFLKSRMNGDRSNLKKTFKTIWYTCIY